MIDRSGRQVTARLRIRIELDDTEPPVWRLVEVPSTLGLDGLHEVIQVAFGWEDAHLHRFTTVADDGRRQDYLCPFEVADGAHGDPEEQARVDEPLARVGARLDYVYDYGDGWHHVLEVVEVVPDAGQPWGVTCLDGARPGPPEDCGGPHGYNLIVAAQDPDHPLTRTRWRSSELSTGQRSTRGSIAWCRSRSMP